MGINGTYNAVWGGCYDEQQGKSDALGAIMAATNRANAKAARLLAERECPADLIEWGRSHGFPTFAEVTWQAGFLAGMRVAMLDQAEMKDGETDDG